MKDMYWAGIIILALIIAVKAFLWYVDYESWEWVKALKIRYTRFRFVHLRIKPKEVKKYNRCVNSLRKQLVRVKHKSLLIKSAKDYCGRHIDKICYQTVNTTIDKYYIMVMPVEPNWHIKAVMVSTDFAVKVKEAMYAVKETDCVMIYRENGNHEVITFSNCYKYNKQSKSWRELE